jgi:predicted acylesterase/phospholipase RssA
MHPKLQHTCGVICEGGAQLGQAYPEAYEILEKHCDLSKIEHFVGTSAGSLFVLPCALRYQPREIREIQDSTDWSTWASAGILRRAWGTLTRRGMHSLEAPQAWIEAQIARAGLPVTLTFRQLREAKGAALYVVATRLGVQADGRVGAFPVTFDPWRSPETPVRDAVLASMAIPEWYPFVRVDGFEHFDGGFGRNFSVDTLAHLEPEQVVAFRVDTPRELASPYSPVEYSQLSRIQVALATLRMLRESAQEAHVPSRYYPRVVRCVAPVGFDPLDFTASPEQIAELRACMRNAFEAWLQEETARLPAEPVTVAGPPLPAGFKGYNLPPVLRLDRLPRPSPTPPAKK